MEVKKLFMKCGKHGGLFSVRIEKRSDTWVRVSTAKLKEDELYANYLEASTSFVHGEFPYVSGFKGCPYCGAKDFLTCSSCKKLTCIEWGTTTGCCQWDGYLMYNLEWRSMDMATKGKESQ